MVTYIWSLSPLWIFCHLKNHGPWWCSSCRAGVCVADRPPGIILEFITVVFDSVCSPISRAGGRGLLSVLPCKYLNWCWLWHGSCLSPRPSLLPSPPPLSSCSYSSFVLSSYSSLSTVHSCFCSFIAPYSSLSPSVLPHFHNVSSLALLSMFSSDCFPNNVFIHSIFLGFDFCWILISFFSNTDGFPSLVHKFYFHSLKLDRLSLFFHYPPHIHFMYVNIHYGSVSDSFQVDLVDGMREWHLVRYSS